MTPARTPGIVVAVGLAVVAGVAIAVQVRLNSELSIRVGSGLVAAGVSFAGGLLVAGLALCSSSSGRAAVRRLRRATGLPRWTYLGGIGGALFMVTAVVVTPVVGVAMVSVAALAGQLTGGLGSDHIGLPGTRRRVTARRVLGVLVALSAVAAGRSALDDAGAAAVGATSLVFGAGIAIALQAAANGRLRTSSSALAATTVNYAVGSAALACALVVAATAFTLDPGAWPANPVLYTGGVLGVGVIAALAVATSAIGVLRMTLATVVGQLGAACLLDAILPSGPGFDPRLLIASALTLAAVGIVGQGSTRPARTTRSDARHIVLARDEA